MRYIQLFDKRIIHRKEGIPYLIRRTLLGIGQDSRWFSIKIHKILISDEECLHNHPWAFISIMLKGSYTEYIKAEPWSYRLSDPKWDVPSFSAKNGFYTQNRTFRRGNILFRPARWAHRLKLPTRLVNGPDGKCPIEQPIPVYTLVFTFKKIQHWGFFTPTGWMPWYKYSEEKHC